VPLGIQKHIEDQIALGGSLEPSALEMLLENLLLFTLHNGPAGIAKIIHARIEPANIGGLEVPGSGFKVQAFAVQFRDGCSQVQNSDHGVFTRPGKLDYSLNPEL
jgi:hypothetical protein